jgi:hypothetical protein
MNTPATTAKAVQCPSCGASITLRALGHSVMVSCASCGAQIDVSRPEIQLIEKYRQKVGLLRLPLGTRGTLRGQVYEVVGAMQRVVDGYRWQEYLLFNPYVGFRWLVLDAGHWNFGEMVKDTAGIEIGPRLEYRGESYDKFQAGTPKVEWVVGEFYWRVAAGDTVNTSDYVAPPRMMSLEKSQGENTWTLLEYIEPEEIHEAFNRDVGNRSGIAPNQPNPSKNILRAIMPMLLLTLAALVVAQVFTVMNARDSKVLQGKYYFGQGHPQQQVFGPFKLASRTSLNELRVYVSLNNSWAEFACSLVNTATGQSIDFTNAQSYYSGRDSDGAWTEEEGDDTSLVASVPAGEYNLVVEGDAGGDRASYSREAYLQVVHDVAPWRNFWLALGLVLVYPLFLFWRRYQFERDRWYESDFDPYERGDED